MDNQLHYCGVHNTKYFRNEKVDSKTGESKVWYSHKIKGEDRYCNEKAVTSFEQPALLPFEEKPLSGASKAMYACNAMNNAVALAANGKIEVEEIGREFKKILSNLQGV